MPLPLSDWESFYVITGGAGAGLTGLMFVVVALAADRVGPTSSDGISVFSTPTVIHFSSVMVIAALMSVPHQNATSLTVCLALGGIGGVFAMTIAAMRMRKFEQYSADHGDWLWHIILPLAGYTAILISAVVLDASPNVALAIVATVSVAFLLIGIHNAWDVAVYLVAMQRTGGKPAAMPPAADPPPTASGPEAT